MARSRASQFTTVRTEGGLLPADLLARVAADDRTVPGLSPEAYHLVKGERLNDRITRSWNRLVTAWKAFAPALAALPERDNATTLTRERWLLPLLEELGYGRVQTAKAIDVEGRSYPVSHGWAHVPLHLVGARIELDRRTPGVAGAAGASPHGLVQELLNRTNRHLWAMVSNGLRLRLLRDNASLTRQAFVEFDLETMFSDEVFDDFVVLWLTCHESRVEGDDPTQCWLERWTVEAAESGTRAREQLREGVEHAITQLGTGFLEHPANTTLKDRLRSGDLDKQDYYRQLLRVVYRLLFLFVAEDRNLLHPPGTGDEERQRYARFYSLGRIRTLAGKRRGGPHPDQWRSLQVVFEALGHPDGLPTLGLAPLGSFLWSEAACPDFDDTDISNQRFLAAVRHLAFVEDRDERVLRQVDYRNLGTEELGAIYEGLLEQHPDLNVDASLFELGTAAGNERKTTGSYYTPTSLITTLLDSSLDQLLDEAASSDNPEEALLALRVIDPACGSGHFLIAAAHRIARRVAAVRTGESSPSPDAERHALRDVIAKCIFGIDINPMAVELCKVSLWMEAVDPGRPLSFLDHHIVHGNGLIGATPRLLDEGVPDNAFTAIEGDDKKVVTARRKTNAHQRANRNQATLALSWDADALSLPIASEIAKIEAIAGDTPEEIAEQARRFEALQASAELERARFAADAWCAAFTVIKDRDTPAITDEIVRLASVDPSSLPPPVRQTVAAEVDAHAYLHWHLAFPQVYSPDTSAIEGPGWTGGFDLVLGNPPWDTLSPDAKEFFASFNPSIRTVKKSEQEQIITALRTDEAIDRKWVDHRRLLFTQVHFMKESGRYTMFASGNLGKGDFNVYRMFVEVALTTARRGGYIAQVTPSGLYGGANASAIRRHLFEKCEIAMLAGLVNRRGHWFPGIHSDTSFAVIAARVGATTEQFRAGFAITNESGLLALRSNPIYLDVASIRAQSPEELAVSEVTSDQDASVVRRVYRAAPKFGEAVPGFPSRRYQREVDMGSDRDLFDDVDDGLPLYEGRMIDQYDHRAKAYVSGRGRSAVWESISFGSPQKRIGPQWRVPESRIPAKVGDRVNRYRVGFCDVTGPRNERSLLAALIPPGSICGHSVPTFTLDEGEYSYLVFLAVANSFVADFLIRKRVGLHVSLTILDSLPIPRLGVSDEVMMRLARPALRLTCTSTEMTDYWNAMAAHGWVAPVPPNTVPPDALVEPASRDEARAEIDVVVAKLVYGLSKDELAYVLDQFPVVEKRDRKAHGSYVTKERILGRYDDV